MKIVVAKKRHIKAAYQLACELRKWFHEEDLKNMQLDFAMNHLVVVLDKRQVIGFLCYTTFAGKILLMWLGVKNEYQRKGVGRKLLAWLEVEAKNLQIDTIESETLAETYDYEPYKLTRAFYYKNGFKKILEKKNVMKTWKHTEDKIVLEKKLIS